MIAAICSMACKKTNQHSDRFINLLGAWEMTSYGNEKNSNGQLASSDIKQGPTPPFEKIESEYFSNGTGKGYIETSGTEQVQGTFEWSFQNDEQILRITQNPSSSSPYITDGEILGLSYTTLILKQQSSSAISFEAYTKK